MPGTPWQSSDGEDPLSGEDLSGFLTLTSLRIHGADTPFPHGMGLFSLAFISLAVESGELRLGDVSQGICNLFSSIKWSNTWSTKPGDNTAFLGVQELLQNCFPNYFGFFF